MALLPRYPIYVPSKGRADRCLTARFLAADGVPFRVVVEEPEVEAYAARVGRERLLVLPFRDRGLFAARNWIKDHAAAEGYERHWQLDDNIYQIRRWYRDKRIPCRSGAALALVEDFSDRYSNVAVSGLNYTMFGVSRERLPPFRLNVHVYSCSLVLNATPHRWRSRYNDDTDYCLQVLADGWCTILINAFLCDKIATMVVRGGNTDDLYQGAGRLRMARALERLWPGVVQVRRRFGRAQHHVRYQWAKFDTRLIRKPGLSFPGGPDEYGLRLVRMREPKSAALRRWLGDEPQDQGSL